MVVGRTLRRAAVILLTAGTAAIWFACSESAPSPAGPTDGFLRDLRTAIAVQQRHTSALLQIPGVVGTAVTGLDDGRAGVLILAERADVMGLPVAIDGVPVTVRVTGRIMALSDPTQRRRPAPMGYSVGHPAITAGTIGARVRDALGRVYILSNNHVLANSNGAHIGDAEYQPGPFDGGTAADQIATLSDFQVIAFNGASNTIDAAIALSNVTVLDNAVPSDDGYGMPSSRIYGDANGDGVFDDRNALLGLNVQKYGRTTKLTHGQITGVNATVTVCYEATDFVCTKSARYVDQLIITPPGFSNGGDSGSLIVGDDANLNPVGLLFAGSSTITIANRIDLVLNRFGVTIDGSSPPPPGPFTDVGVLSVSGPESAVQHRAATISVLVKNVGNQDVGGFSVVLEDTTAHGTIGTQAVSGLAAGAATTLTFAWTPATAGNHDLVARHTLSDDRALNNLRLATIPVEAPLTDVAVSTISVVGAVIDGHVVNVNVGVDNVGNVDVGSFDVMLRDATANVTLGSQTVSSLAAHGGATRTFSWNLTGAVIGQHLLIATHSLSDDSTANNQRNVLVTVNPKPTDLALTSITAPQRVNQGDTAHVVVTVKNVGELDVTSSFTIEVVDGQADNAVVATQTVAGGLVVGATRTVDIPWNTAGAAISGHTLIATQTLAQDAVWNNNSMAISVIVQQPPVLDLGITSITAPAAVFLGNTAAVTVNIQNVGGQNIASSFDLVLRDATAGTTIGTQTVPGLVPSGSTSRTFNWNTTGTTLGAHSLVATHSLADANAANNQASATIAVNQPTLDVAVTLLSAPTSVPKGGSATIGVNVQNVGGANVGTSFNVVLTDSTAGVTIGSQAVTSLPQGSSALKSFTWSTANAALGNHVLVATHTLADDNAANNQRSATISVLQTPADISLAAISAPGSATVGDTVPVAVTVQNVGGTDVTATFDVVLTDGQAGNAVVGTQSVSGLAAGASATRSFSWNTAGAVLGGHILTATQKLADPNVSNNARAVAVTVNAPSVHVGNIDGFFSAVTVDTWSANVRVTAHDSRHNPVNGVTVRGNWNSGPEVQCVTSDAEVPGTCVLTLAGLPIATRSAYFGMSGMSLTGSTYKPASNHDPDGSSNGFGIFVRH
jgi:hypothetical protein